MTADSKEQDHSSDSADAKEEAFSVSLLALESINQCSFEKSDDLSELLLNDQNA